MTNQALEKTPINFLLFIYDISTTGHFTSALLFPLIHLR